MKQLTNIISNIRDEKCILIIGPDLVDFGEKTFFKCLCEELISNGRQKNIIDAIPEYVFANDEVFQLTRPSDKTTLKGIMKTFYEKQTHFDEPLAKISQIPFHLIISLMPDDRLKNIFINQGINYDYSYYPISEGEGEAPQPVVNPTKEKPLIYNLMGDLNETGTVITFEHLFTFLSGIMGKRPLPEAIREALKKADSFIFLGVRFEKWYVQLLLQIITSNDKIKYMLRKKNNDNGICTFIATRFDFDLEFLQEEVEPMLFLDALYNAFNTLGILKTSRTNSKGKVFISYNHKDKQIAEYIEQKLTAAGIDVIRDETTMHGGEEIDQFITKFISATDHVKSVVSIVSENSLMSPWVSIETATAFDKKKDFLPCYLDKSFEDDNFVDKALVTAHEKTKEIGLKIATRINEGRTFEDLSFQLDKWKRFKDVTPGIAAKLRNTKVYSILPDDIDGTIQKLINHILNL